MRIVIQCAGSKRPEAGTFRAADGRRVAFVADPALGPSAPDALYAHPDEPSDQPGQTWRDRVVEANRTRANPCGLLPAGRLYAPGAYALLERFVGPERLFVLSAGWGLVRSDFLLPRYDITFSGSAERHKRRRPAHGFEDFKALDGLPADDTVFLGGKDYLPLFLRLSAACRGRRRRAAGSAAPPGTTRNDGNLRWSERLSGRRSGRWMQTGRDALPAYCHDRHPVLGRCPGNVVGRPDRRGNLYPAKQRPEQKIDAAVALMMTVGRARTGG